MKMLDTSWFTLTEYEEMRGASVARWIVQIKKRRDVISRLSQGNLDINERALILAEIMVRPISWVGEIEIDDQNGVPREIVTVHDIHGTDLSEALNPIGIDLRAEDAQILSDFSKWLKLKRTKNKGSVRITPRGRFMRPDGFDRWADEMLLAYIDLQIVVKVLGERLANHKIGHLIYPNDFDVDIPERVRKVTKPHADSLLSDDNYNMLILKLDVEESKKAE